MMNPYRLLAAAGWPDTSPAGLNRLASELDPGVTSAYVDYHPAPYPRPFNLRG